MVPPVKRPPFQALTPERVISLVEKALGVRCTNLCRPLHSYINRVFEVSEREGQALIVKFYRPGRWSLPALRDEHDFLGELEAEEIPVVAPRILQDGSTLGRNGRLRFAIFPKRGGRSVDEFSDHDWLQIGRLLGRIHAVGARRRCKARLVMTPEASTRAQVDGLLHSGLVPPQFSESFRQLTDTLIAEIAPLFQGVPLQRIHGDCHFANLLQRPGESFLLIDFDDMVMGPAVQDLWMLLPGYHQETLAEIDLFLEGYETFCHFDRRTLRLIEPLRAMRYIHYIAWCAQQVAQDGPSRLEQDFGTPDYWRRELHDLDEQLTRIRQMTTAAPSPGALPET